MKILIKITEEILRKSHRCTNNYGENCGISLAIREVFPLSRVRSNDILVFKSEIQRRRQAVTKSIKDAAYRIYLPEVASEFIQEFDGYGYQELPGVYPYLEARLTMKPISFEIDIPTELIEQIGISEAYKILSESKTLELVSI